MTKNQIERERNLEVARNNRVVEQETAFSNRVREAETAYHNRIMEQISREQTTINRSAAEETARANQARELETNRANVVSEKIRHDSNYISANTLSETIAHNRAQESTNLLLATTSQYDSQTRRLAQIENERANKVGEHIRATTNDISKASLSETQRSNLVRESETHRQNTLNAATSILNTLGAIGNAVIRAKGFSSGKVRLK